MDIGWPAAQKESRSQERPGRLDAGHDSAHPKAHSTTLPEILYQIVAHATGFEQSAPRQRAGRDAAIHGLDKAEVRHRSGPRKTKQAEELATLEWASWFNHHGLMGPRTDLPPAEFNANDHRQRADQAATA
jgi:hypothetical protein